MRNMLRRLNVNFSDILSDPGFGLLSQFFLVRLCCLPFFMRDYHFPDGMFYLRDSVVCKIFSGP